MLLEVEGIVTGVGQVHPHLHGVAPGCHWLVGRQGLQGQLGTAMRLARGLAQETTVECQFGFVGLGSRQQTAATQGQQACETKARRQLPTPFGA